jgi:putative aldouronate transport system substrate-binding protein
MEIFFGGVIMRKRMQGLVIVFALLVPAIAFANGAQGKTSGPESGQKVKYTLPALGKFNPPVVITTAGVISSSTTFKNNETLDNNVHTKWALERLGVDIKYPWIAPQTNNVWNTRMRLALSSGETLPDVISITDINLLTELIDSGLFMEVGDLWDQTASANYHRAVDQIPTIWYPVTRANGRFGLPIPEQSWNHDTVMWYRTDWLKKLGLEAPKTLAELEKVMDAFVNNDPDGNGRKDTVGLTVGLKSGMVPYAATACFIFGAYGDLPEQWNLMSDGTLAYGSIQPSTKQALAKIKEWMDKGYIHKEAGLHDTAKANELFTTGYAGVIASPVWGDRYPQRDLFKNVPTADYQAFPVPTGPDGKAGRIGTVNYIGFTLIRKGYEHPEAFMLYYNYLFDYYAELTGEFEKGFAEGYDWQYDSKGVPTHTFPGRINTQKYTLTIDGARIPESSPEEVQKAIDRLHYLQNGGVPRNGSEQKTQSYNDDRSYQANYVNLDSVNLTRPNYFMGAPTATMRTKWETLQTMEREIFLKIIYGDLPLSAFDKFVTDWNAGGGAQITKEVNEWYKGVSSK